MDSKRLRITKRRRLYRKAKAIQYKSSHNQQLLQRAMEEPDLLTPDNIMELQQTMGNQFVLNLVNQKTASDTKPSIQRSTKSAIVDGKSSARVVQRGTKIRSRGYGIAQAKQMVANYEKFCWHGELSQIFSEVGKFDGTYETASEQEWAIASKYKEKALHYREKIMKYFDTNLGKDKLISVGFKAFKSDRAKTKEVLDYFGGSSRGKDTPVQDKINAKARKKYADLLARHGLQ